uniref:Uncharacterized protein n=1 Tax=Tetradesmus obliquus TaxID=3088 RepID=A0A383VPY2_TETOB|eukprot:jgi/Sobl393_1/15053/SZX66802.1
MSPDESVAAVEGMITYYPVLAWRCATSFIAYHKPILEVYAGFSWINLRIDAKAVTKAIMGTMTMRAILYTIKNSPQGMVRLMQICRDWVMHTFVIPAFGPLLTVGVAIIMYLRGVLTEVIVQLVNVAKAFMNAAKTFLKMLWSVIKGIFRVLQSVTGTRPAFGQETLDNCPSALRTGILPAQRD